MTRLASGEKPAFLAANPAEGVSEALFNIASTMTRQNSAQLALIYGRLSIYLKPDFDLAQMLVAGILESMNRNADAIELISRLSRHLRFTGRRGCASPVILRHWNVMTKRLNCCAS